MKKKKPVCSSDYGGTGQPEQMPFLITKIQK